MKQFETDRLIIRTVQKKDITQIYEIFSDKDLNTYLPWNPLKSLEDAIEFYELFYKNTLDHKFAVCLKEDNLMIGYIHLSNAKSHDFGYGLLAKHQGKGIITEASQCIIPYAKDIGLPYITATHDIKNHKSGAVMNRLNMTYQYPYEELWQPKNIKVHFRLYQKALNINNMTPYLEYWEKYPVHYIETALKKGKE